MDKKILLATDGSEYSEGAVREAINIAKSCGSVLNAMSVIEINPEFFAMAPQIIEDKEKEIKKYLEGVRDRASNEGIECQINIREGEEPYKLIIEEAEKNAVDTIILGRRGRKGIMRLLMGSVTERVIGNATQKIFVIPRNAYIKWKGIVIASDGSIYSVAAAREAINLIKNCCKDCTLNVISVIRPSASEERVKLSQDAIQEIQSNAEKENIKVDSFVVKNKPHELIHEAIIEYTKDKEADIISMGSYGRTGLKKLLMGSVTEKVIGYTTCPVMVVKS